MNRLLTVACVFMVVTCAGRAFAFRVDSDGKTVMIADGTNRLQLRLAYDAKCVIDSVIVNGRAVVAPETGVCSAIKKGGQWHTTRGGIATPQVAEENGAIVVRGIRYGAADMAVEEVWTFTETADAVVWRIQRRYEGAGRIDDTYFAGWDFGGMDTWTGALLDTGGVAWCKLMSKPNASYGVHGASALFWNKDKNDCLRVQAEPGPGTQMAMRFTHQPSGVFSFNHSVTSHELTTKYELRRFLEDKQDVWNPFDVAVGEVAVEYRLSAPAYDVACYRGDFKGIDGGAIREICNTIGRIGNIDRGIMGSNGWYSGYACMHEQWFAQMGLAIDDPLFFANYTASLNFQRDHAIAPDGRVKSRWAYGPFDAMPNTYEPSGFYEAQWGILLDSQPCFVINVAEQFDFTGDIDWVRTMKAPCEKVLAYVLRRDSNGNGLYEVMTDSHKEAKGSDWIDVIWAAFENGYVNVEMYHALRLWAAVEEVLGDVAAADTYRAAAAGIKEQFNKPIQDGGLWDPDKRWYAYWRNRDGSVHGNNYVTPVNLMALAYGVCDDAQRQAAILDTLEDHMQKEGLFFWPLCIYSYEKDEAYKVNWPFPAYENGDLFLAWGEIGMRAYARYKPEIAVKYAKNVIARYEQDGLAFQRYLRTSQKGEGGDILANNMLPVVGLYRNIYGIQPRFNRLYLEPHLTRELAGTTLRYVLRGQTYEIMLQQEAYQIVCDNFSVRAGHPAAVAVRGATLDMFEGESEMPGLSITRPAGERVEAAIESWRPARRFTVASDAGCTLHCTASGLQPGARYELIVNGQKGTFVTADASGAAPFDVQTSAGTVQAVELR